MDDTGLGQGVEVRAVQVGLPVLHMVLEPKRRRRNEGGLLDAATRAAYPVLILAELARGLFLTAHALHEHAVQPAHGREPDGTVLHLFGAEA